MPRYTSLLTEKKIKIKHTSTQQTFLTYFFKLYIHMHMHMCTHTNAISGFINLESFCLYKQLEIWKLHTTHQPSLVELM